jgi:uncharacterized protein
MNPDTLPLFPLGTVLFPQGQLPLRVFEARYTDMVRQCLKTQTPFGVCLIHSGKEVAEPSSSFLAVGCSATIADVDMQQLGLLLINTVGQQRFEVLDHEVQKDGLVLGKVKWIEADAPCSLPSQYQSLADLLERISQETDRLSGPLYLDDAVWVSNRIAELLPVSMMLKHKLMALEDAQARLMLAQQILEKATAAQA